VTNQRDILEKLSALPPPAAPPMSTALEAELAQLAPVRTRRPARDIAVLVAISIACGAAVLAVVTTRRDLGELPIAWMVGAGIAWAAGFGAACALAIVPRAGDVMPRWPRAAVVAVVLSIGFVALGLRVHPSGPSSLDYGWPRFAHGHWCLELGLVVALVPVVIGAIALRGVLPVGSRWVAVALGAGGGCLGGLVLHFHCPIADRLHIGLIHGGVVAIAATLAGLIVPRATDRPLQ